MNKPRYYLMLLLFVLVWAVCRKSSDTRYLTGSYLGQSSPGMTPEVFAPGVISKAGFHLHSCLAFSPDGNEIYFTKMVFEPERQGTICVMKRVGSGWTKPETASFSSRYSDDSPAFTPDGRRLYFSSTRPETEEDDSGDLNFWVVERREKGWSEPALADSVLNTEHCDFRLSISRRGAIYFSSDRGCNGCGLFDIFMSKPGPDGLSRPVMLGSGVNSPVTEQIAFIDPDERYLVFYRYDKKKRDETGLYVSFRREDGTWTRGVNMGDAFNAPADACTQAASLSPDGKYIFFLRRDRESIYWVDAGIIDQVRPHDVP